jgi:hypothetical protein
MARSNVGQTDLADGAPVPLAMMPQTQWREADRETFARAWETEIAQVPEFTGSEIYIVASLPLPIWKRLANESTRVYRFQTDAGERIIGHLPMSPPRSAPARRACRQTTP